jgi:hypothetical protein
MEYRGVEFTVLQSASPRGWRWTVEITGRKPKSAVVCDRAGAILHARRAIDAALGSPERSGRAVNSRDSGTTCEELPTFARINLFSTEALRWAGVGPTKT